MINSDYVIFTLLIPNPIPRSIDGYSRHVETETLELQRIDQSMSKVQHELNKIRTQLDPGSSVPVSPDSPSSPSSPDSHDSPSSDVGEQLSASAQANPVAHVHQGNRKSLESSDSEQDQVNINTDKYHSNSSKTHKVDGDIDNVDMGIESNSHQTNSETSKNSRISVDKKSDPSLN